MRCRQFKFDVFNAQGNHVANIRHAEDAAALVGILGDGTTIRGSETGTVFWTEGKEFQSASESFDFVESIMRVRSTY